jgi:hypothetical protein
MDGSVHHGNTRAGGILIFSSDLENVTLLCNILLHVVALDLRFCNVPFKSFYLEVGMIHGSLLFLCN